MVIGIARITLIIPGSRSLKQKRSVMSSVKDRMKNDYNVSVMEEADHDRQGKSVLALACISRNGEILQQTFDDIGESLERRRDLMVTAFEIDIES